MKILYIAVHYDKNENKWRSETWINNSFKKINIETIRLDYRQIIKQKNISFLKKTIKENSKFCDLIFLQRGEKLTPDLFREIKIPIIFWSTEPINLKNDVDKLLGSNIFSWVFVHTYSCLDRVNREFKHLNNNCSVLHNALPDEKIKFNSSVKKHFAIFNRNLSLRRRLWLYPNLKYIKIIKGKYGADYFNDLSESYISVNVHYSSKNLDDFETGIFEAIASGSVVISEKLDNRVLKDLKLEDSIIQVESPMDLNKQLFFYKKNISELNYFKEKSKNSISYNTWTSRMKTVKEKFEEILNSIS